MRLLTVVNKNVNKIVKPVEVNVKSEQEILKELSEKLLQDFQFNDSNDISLDNENNIDNKDNNIDNKDNNNDNNDNNNYNKDNNNENDDNKEEKSTISKKEEEKADLIFNNIDKACEFEIEKFIKDCWKKSVSLKNNLNSKLLSSKIPFIVYQSYSTKILPEKMEINNALLKISNPEFDFVLVDFDEQRDFISKNFKENVLQAYDNLGPIEFKNNLWVYCNLYLNGGVYLDIGYGNLNNFKLIELVNKNYFVIDKNNSLLAINTNLIITESKNIVLLKAINSIVDNVSSLTYGNNLESITGSLLLSSIVHKNEKNIKRTIDSYELSFLETSIFRKGEEIFSLYKEFVSENLILNKVNDLWTKKLIYKNDPIYDTSKLITIDENRENSDLFDFVDKIVYMKSLDEELLKNIPMKKLYCMDTNKNNLYILKTIKLAMDNNWSNLLILDDNFVWDNFDEGYNSLKEMVKSNYDVIVIGGVNVKSNKLFKLIQMDKLNGFIINKSYYSKLYENVKETVDKLTANPKAIVNIYGNMKKLLKDNWLIISPLMTK